MFIIVIRGANVKLSAAQIKKQRISESSSVWAMLHNHLKTAGSCSTLLAPPTNPASLHHRGATALCLLCFKSQCHLLRWGGLGGLWLSSLFSRHTVRMKSVLINAKRRSLNSFCSLKLHLKYIKKYIKQHLIWKMSSFHKENHRKNYRYFWLLWSIYFVTIENHLDQ